MSSDMTLSSPDPGNVKIRLTLGHIPAPQPWGSRGAASSMAGMSDFESMRAEDVPEGVQLVDVREANEFAEWHAKGAENLPLSELQLRYGELDLDQDLYIICLSGGRSAKACQWLELNGIDAINVSNGTIGWRDAGRTIIVNGEETTNPA